MVLIISVTRARKARSEATAKAAVLHFTRCAAVDWAQFFGVSIRELDFQNALPKSGNPETGFVGNPNGEPGQIPPRSYVVHAGPVATLLRNYGVNAVDYRRIGWDDLRSEVAAGRPVLPLVSYAPILVRQNQADRGGHFFVITGYDATYVYVNDPDFWNQGRYTAEMGHNLRVPLTQFAQSISTSPVPNQACFMVL